jgi:dihydroorotate dehydrogenase electron transfer subunit
MSPMLMTRGEVLSHKKYGEHFHSLTIVVPEIGEAVKPGQFVNIKCGEDRSHILRRPFSVYRVHKRGGWASTVEIVFDLRGPGTEHLSQLRTHSIVDVIGPAGKGFTIPKSRAHCLLVGGGIGAAPLFFLADELRNEGHRVDIILGARNTGLLLNPIEARRVASVCRLTTDDGSMGDEGLVTDVLYETMEKCKTEVVFACGPHPMLAAVSRICTDQDIPVQAAVEELMACGYGVCMTCVMPLQRQPEKDEDPEDAIVYARSCTEGPVFNGAKVVWNGAHDIVALDQSELSPLGAPTRASSQFEPEDEFAPPGN